MKLIHTSYIHTKFDSSLVSVDPSRCGLRLNISNPTGRARLNFPRLSYLDTQTGFIYANDSDIENLSSDFNGICAQLEQSVLIHVRKIPSIVGKITSLSALWECCSNYDKVFSHCY